MPPLGVSPSSRSGALLADPLLGAVLAGTTIEQSHLHSRVSSATAFLAQSSSTSALPAVAAAISAAMAALFKARGRPRLTLWSRPNGVVGELSRAADYAEGQGGLNCRYGCPVSIIRGPPEKPTACRAGGTVLGPQRTAGQSGLVRAL